MEYVVEYRYRFELGQKFTDWKEHHATSTKEEALEAIEYLERMELEDRADGLLARFEETQYRVVERA